ncbi:hypothetical protein [Halobacillus litoralis]|uniref:PLD phosphodiesterase domain-containing protein n=1 Tax=Halobacillus litoralis TaxID=45668 RepID=A0A410MCC6_9BACI|nr:hypothetical protein [Halobacillus litoralis]QAS52350.1 hypothetical protein HLI_08960 [Halobacillus litoralis]
MDKINILEELKHNGYKVALFSSFSTDLVFFEKMILRHLLDNGCTYIGLFIDHNSLQDSVKHPNITELGKSYLVTPMETNHAFHPKVYLLLGEKKAKLIIGSGNLTPSGFITNKELFNVFTYEVGRNKDHLHIINAALSMFWQTKPSNNKLMEELMAQLQTFYYLNNFNRENNALSMFMNLERSIQDQLSEILPEVIKRIDCMTPYFDQSLAVINHWHQKYNPEKVSIYLQNKTTNFPLTKKDDSRFDLYEVNFTEDNHKRYHGKVFRFIGEQEEVIVYGSANCSRQALLQTSADGNTEAVIAEKGPKGKFDSFFDEEFNFVPLTDLFELMPEEANQEQQKQTIQFIEGVLDQNKLTIKLKSTISIDQVHVCAAQGKKIDQVESYYTYVFDRNLDKLKETFDILITTPNQVLECVGWYHDTQMLLKTFANMKDSPYHYLEKDSNLEEYQTLVGLLDDLNNRLILTEDDIEQANQQRGSTNIHQQAELRGDKEHISDNLDDYYVSTEEPVKSYGVIGGVDVFTNLIRALNRHFQNTSEEPMDVKQETPPSGNNEITIKEMDVKLLEKRMKRFIKKFHRGIHSRDYLEKVNNEILIKNIAIYNGFLWKLYDVDTGFISTGDLIQENLDIAKTMESYCEMNILDGESMEVRDIVTKLLSSIVAKEYLLASEDNYDQVRMQKKELALHLKKIHQHVYPIRETYRDFWEQIQNHLNKLNLHVKQTDFENFLEARFPICTFEQFIHQLRTITTFTVVQEPFIDETKLILSREVNINAEFNLLQLNLLCKMLSVEEWEGMKSFKIIWRNSNDQAPLARFILYYNQRKNVLKQKFVYRKSLNRDSKIREKKHVYKHSLQVALEKGDPEIIARGYK